MRALSKSSLLGAAAVALVACERPTAPQARDAVAATEAKILSGDYASLESGISSLFLLASQYGYSNNPNLLSDTATLVRNGQSHGMRATVIERLYLPPVKSGGIPFTRRSVVAWSADAMANPDRMRMLVLFSADTQSSIVVPTRGSANLVGDSSRAQRVGFALTLDPGDRRAWFGTEGQLTIGEGVPYGPCPYTGKFARYQAPIADLQDSTKAFDCDARHYVVSASAFVERGDPNQRSLLAQLLPRDETVRMPAAVLPGVRFVTQCEGDGRVDPPDCYEPFIFWRENSQFNKDLGVDLRAMRRFGNAMGRIVAAGEGPDYRYERGGFDVPVALAVHAADGRILLQRERTTFQTDSTFRNLVPDFQEFPQRKRSKVQLLKWGSPELTGSKRQSMVVINLEFLPF